MHHIMKQKQKREVALQTKHNNSIHLLDKVLTLSLLYRG